jgi:hypothetical protein
MSRILAACRVCGLQADVNRQQLSPFPSTRTTHISHAEMEHLCRHAERHDGSLSCVVLQRTIDRIELETITLSGIDKVDLDRKQMRLANERSRRGDLDKGTADEVQPLVMTAAPKFAKIDPPKDSVSRRIEYLPSRRLTQAGRPELA